MWKTEEESIKNMGKYYQYHIAIIKRTGPKNLNTFVACTSFNRNTDKHFQEKHNYFILLNMAILQPATESFRTWF